MFIVEVSKEGEIVIPSSLREKYAIFSGMKLRVADEGGVITIRPLLKDILNEAKKSLNGSQKKSPTLSK